ncbi:uncharacterized protein LOC144657052 [Oculina patagonica]
MDHLTILVCLIGVCIIFPFCINGEKTIPARINGGKNTPAPYTGCKARETNSPPSRNCNRYCGEQIMVIWKASCKEMIKRSSTELDVGLKREDALQFLSLSHRPRRRRKRSTDIDEECCQEKCSAEEVIEYCYLVLKKIRKVCKKTQTILRDFLFLPYYQRHK